jgi:REP element-mobilizing transposase RayT
MAPRPREEASGCRASPASVAKRQAASARRSQISRFHAKASLPLASSRRRETTPQFRLPLRDAGGTLPPMPPRCHRVIIGHHLILNGYGHWLPNDPRGSGSDAVRKESLQGLGDVHFGRKVVQPPREELRAFFKQAEPLLEYRRLWFDDAKRQAVATAIGEVIAAQRYTVWGCAILKNHAHLCIRRHRDDAVGMWEAFAEASRDAVRRFADVPPDHPVWSDRPYKIFLDTPADVERVVRYIAENPAKEGLPAQQWPFVVAYDGWPHGR